MNSPETRARLDYFIDLLLDKRQSVNGTDGEITIYFDDLDLSYIPDIQTLIDVLEQLKTDYIDFKISRKVIKDYKRNNNEFIIEESNTKGLKLYKENLLASNELHAEVNRLKNLELNFDASTSQVYLTGLESHKLPLPQYKNEYYLMKLLFEHDKNEGIGYGEVYGEQNGENTVSDSSPDMEKQEESVYDTIRRFNQRMERYFGIKQKVITMKDRVVKRLI